jgi:hypothetical protein
VLLRIGQRTGRLDPYITREIREAPGVVSTQRELLEVGFRPMYRLYRKRRPAGPAPLIYLGHTKSAQDLGYLYVDPTDPILLPVLELTYEGEIWAEHGPLMELLFGHAYPDLVKTRRKELDQL